MAEVTAFQQTVEEALKHYGDPEWLGNSSPLASPFLLGPYLTMQIKMQIKQPMISASLSAGQRGRVLQRLLGDTSQRIEGKNAERYQVILREYYFRDRSVEAVCDLIGLGRNSFHLSRNAAIASLCELLMAQINPTLRLESPPAIPPLLERDALSKQGLHALEANQSVSLTGGGGLGKTTLASFLASKLRRPTFWYTIRAGLNDHLDAFLFSLGYFLHTCGSSTLWFEMISTSGRMHSDRALGVARYALEQLRPALPLLCVDEVDLLQPQTEGNHAVFVQFIESLRNQTPLLLIGQQAIIDTHLFLTLKEFSKSATRRFLSEKLPDVNDTQANEIHKHTLGNPRLLELLIAIGTSGESIDALLSDPEFIQHPSLEFLLERMFQRLNNAERSILLELSVYRRSVPTYIWGQGPNADALSLLQKRSLVQSDQNTGVELLPAYRAVLYHLLSDEQRRHYHRQAANVRGAAGDTAACAYHLFKSGDMEQVIWLCYENRQSLINQGQAQTTLALLNDIQHHTLSPLARETAQLLSAELERLTGNVSKALDKLHSAIQATPILSIDADLLRGQIANDANDFTVAEKAFRRGLATAEKLIEARIVHLHRGLAWRHLRERELDQALKETEKARYEVEHLQGELEIEVNNYHKSELHYLAAIQIAEAMGHTEGIAKTSVSLAAQYIDQGRIEDIQRYLSKAEDAYRHIGKHVQINSLQLNWATAYNLAHEFERALSTAQRALEFLAKLGSVPPRQQVIAKQIIAEAYLGLGQLDQAAESVKEVIEIEEVSMLAEAYRTFGEILHRQGNKPDAIRFIKMALEIATQNEDRYLEAYAWRALAVCYNGSQPDEAATAFTQAIELFTAIVLPNEVEKTEQLWKC